MMSKSARLGQARNELSLGSTWDQSKDEAAWSRKGVTIPTTRYLRPQYLPKAYEKQEARPAGKLPATAAAARGKTQ
jgi:hypothetical protein